jgi:predicted transcriptional regulator
MAGRKALAITERQFAVLRVLWGHGPQTVRGLMEHLPRGERQPYTTVLGLLQNMEKAGLVDHEKEGLTHRYQPRVSRQEATGSLLSDFLVRFFHGSAEQLILGLVDAEQLAPNDLRAIEERLARAKEQPAPRLEPKSKAKERATRPTPKRKKP